MLATVNRSTLTPTETVGLALQVRLSNEARNELVEANLSIAEQLALYYCKVSSAEYDELRSEGYLALTEAANSYDPLSGWAFESYAHNRVRKAIYLYLGWSGGKQLPAQIRTELRQLGLHSQRLAQKLGREPKVEELAAALGCSSDWVTELNILAIKARSLEAKVGEDDGDELINLIPAPDNAINPEREQAIAQAIYKVGYLLEHTALNQRERLVIEKFFGVDEEGITHTLKEIGAALGISDSRCGQVKAAALLKLKQTVADIPATTRQPEQPPDIEPPSPSATAHQCYICQQPLKRWGSSSFKDWTYLANPTQTNHPGTVPRVWVCYGCSQTEQHRQHLADSLTARRDQLDHTTAVRLELLDPKTGKMSVCWVYAKNERRQRNVKVRQQSKGYPPMCSICHRECRGQVADIAVTNTYSTKWGVRYAMKFICTTCYGRVGQKWEARKREAGLVKASNTVTQETAPHLNNNLSPRQKHFLALALYAMKQEVESSEGVVRWAFHQVFTAPQPQTATPKRQSPRERLAYLLDRAATQVEACTAAWQSLKQRSVTRFTLADNAGVMIVEDKRCAEKAKAAAKRLYLARSQYGELRQAAHPQAPTPAPDQPSYGVRNMTLQGPFFSAAPEPKSVAEICSMRKDAAARLAVLLPPIAQRRVTGWKPALPPPSHPQPQWQWPPETLPPLMPAPAAQL